MPPPNPTLLKTPLHQYHLDAGAKMVDFAGWEMPIVYGPPGGTSSLQDEHRQVRTSGGMFDVSHMGRVKFNGRHARKLIERLCTRRIHDMKAGACRYGLVLNPRGGIMDDVIVYRMDEDDFLMVVNASNREKLLPHFQKVAAEGNLVCKIDDQTKSTAMVAIQGPKVMNFISGFSKEVPSLKRYTFAVKNLLIMKLIVSRTGYTGEDGVEVILPASMVSMAMKLILKDQDPRNAAAIIKPAAWAPATRCAPKPACPCTVTNSPRTLTRSAPAWISPSPSTRTRTPMARAKPSSESTPSNAPATPAAPPSASSASPAKAPNAPRGRA